MSQEDSCLSVRLRRLEIDHNSNRTKKTEKDLNPFMRRRSKSLSSINFGSTCDCTKKTSTVKHTTSFKRPNKKILREPLLKFIRCAGVASGSKCSGIISKEPPRKDKQFGQCSKDEKQDFRSIIDACEQLNLDSDSASYAAPSFLCVRSHSTGNLQKQESPLVNGGVSSGVSSTCSGQARLNMNPPCDVTIDELASYFETFVHIPKKMSSMAEMMYI